MPPKPKDEFCSDICRNNGSCSSPEKVDETFVCTCFMTANKYGQSTERNPECRYHGDQAPLERRMVRFVDVPQGVSEWMNHGKKYGYWDFFRSSLIDEIVGKVEGRMDKNGYDKICGEYNCACIKAYHALILDALRELKK